MRNSICERKIADYVIIGEKYRVQTGYITLNLSINHL